MASTENIRCGGKPPTPGSQAHLSLPAAARQVASTQSFTPFSAACSAQLSHASLPPSQRVRARAAPE